MLIIKTLINNNIFNKIHVYSKTLFSKIFFCSKISLERLVFVTNNEFIIQKNFLKMSKFKQLVCTILTRDLRFQFTLQLRWKNRKTWLNFLQCSKIYIKSNVKQHSKSYYFAVCSFVNLRWNLKNPSIYLFNLWLGIFLNERNKVS